ncbi:MAG: methyltransferase domain-containing protein [Bacteroidota bacterium]
MSAFREQLLQESRLLTVLYDNLAESIKADVVYRVVDRFLQKYTAFNHIDTEAAIQVYTNYIGAYNKHCKQFSKTGKYPWENGDNSFEITREGYDVILLMSILFTSHRFRLMQLVANADTSGKALFIGLGSGIEILLTEKKHSERHGYDITVSKFLYSEFPDVLFKTKLYTGQQEDYFDTIYMIELLEHVVDPFALLTTCSSSLKKGARIVFTTATDMPQFDHLYNFNPDHSVLDKAIVEMGCEIIYKEKISHSYMAMNLTPCNHFYLIEKR